MRQAEIERNPFETKIKLSLNLDAQEPVDIQTGVCKRRDTERT